MKKIWLRNALWLIISTAITAGCKTQTKDATQQVTVFPEPGTDVNIDSLKKIQHLKRDSVLNQKR